ncbi:carotenoid biosynthesis protein [Aurantimicrobium minutum]|uniref:carotenoid biosynthesis protein n=1 Tax=Aurantimicrobium minutum TaxID=708131 RepID=UPI00247502C5|nr:carotenoid biosynthesis protein [Aurantimicrobium minutum]MDH6423873.1 putative membrane protein [Aurantimicrobium minutum]
MFNSTTLKTSVGLWILLAISFGAAFVPAGTPGSITLLIGLVPVTFSMWHFIRWAGARTAWLSFLAVVVISFTGEALGVATGLVFGNYYYPDGPLGPLLLGVPPLIQLQYFAMAYASLMIARSIGGVLTTAARGWWLAAVSAMAAFGMTLLDLASDPWHATVLGQWIWRDGGPYFGIPLHNFFGWFFETLAFLLVVQALLNSKKALAKISEVKPRGFWLQGVLLYGTFPFTIALTPLIQGSAFSQADVDIAVAMVCVALFAIVPLWLAALMSLKKMSSTS